MSFLTLTPVGTSFEQLEYREDGDVATITLNRPEVVNCLSIKLSDELVRAIEKVRQSTALKILVIRGAGNNFCSGDDLVEMRTWGDSNECFRRVRYYQDMAYALEELEDDDRCGRWIRGRGRSRNHHGGRFRHRDRAREIRDAGSRLGHHAGLGWNDENGEIDRPPANKGDQPSRRNPSSGRHATSTRRWPALSV